MAVEQETVTLTSPTTATPQSLTSAQLPPPPINITVPPCRDLVLLPTPPSSPIKITTTPPSSPIKITTTPPSSPIRITTTPPSSPIKITTTLPSSQIKITNSPIKISQDIVIDIDNQQLQKISYTPQVYWRAAHSRFFICFLILLGLILTTLLHASLVVLAELMSRHRSRDLSVFMSYLQHSIGYNLSELVISTTLASGTALLMIHIFAKEYPGYPLYIKLLLLSFLFGIISGPSMLFLEIFATHLGFRVCGWVIFAAYFGGLSYHIGRL